MVPPGIVRDAAAAWRRGIFARLGGRGEGLGDVIVGVPTVLVVVAGRSLEFGAFWNHEFFHAGGLVEQDDVVA